MQRPRPFSHKLIYADERQERLGALRASFAAASQRRKCRGGVRLSTPMLLSAIVILLAILLLIAYSH
ncbi:MAG: hypothetical protein IJ570_09745 [Prevotella sp.]|nr:hypothetical protein [Prevotella sp.]